MNAGSAAGTALVGGRVALLLGADLNSVFLRRLKEAVFARDPVDAVFHVLSEAGLRNLPSFACVIRDDSGIRLLLRGSVAARVRTFSGDDRMIRGEAVSTWAEHLVRDPHEITLQASARNREESTLVLLFDQRDQASRGNRNRRRPDVERSAQPVTSVPAAPQPQLPVVAPPQPPPSDPLAPAVARPQPVRRPPDPWPSRDRDGDPTILPGAPPEPSSRPGEPRPPWAQPNGEFDFSHLLERTQFTGVEAAAMREVVPDEPAPAPPWVPGAGLIDALPSPPRPPAPPASAGGNVAGDHDGDTVSVRRVPTASPDRSSMRNLLRPVVQAVLCLRGHPNAPSASRCRTCQGSITDRSIVQVERPVLGRLRFSDGLVVDLDRPLVLGRKPDHAEVGTVGGEQPGLVALPDPDRALSRVHVEIRLEDWHVVVVDRRSANGTVVELPGEDGMQLHPDQPCPITGGTRVSLADVVSFVFEASV